MARPGSRGLSSPRSRDRIRMRMGRGRRRRSRPRFLARQSAPPPTGCVRDRPRPHGLGLVLPSLRRHRCGSRRRHDERLRRRGRRLSRRGAGRRGRGRYRHRGRRHGRGRRRRGRRLLRRRGLALLHGRGRRRRARRRQERQRVDVALLLRRRPQTEVDVRLSVIRHAARPDGADDGPLPKRGPALDGDRPEVHERRRVTERRLDRNRPSAGRDGAGERHDTLCRRAHGRPGRRAEVDAAVLSARIRVGTIERERAKDRPVDRPRPCPRRGREHEGAERHDAESPNHKTSLLPDWRTVRPYQGRAIVVNTGYKVRR